MNLRLCHRSAAKEEGDRSFYPYLNGLLEMVTSKLGKSPVIGENRSADEAGRGFRRVNRWDPSPHHLHLHGSNGFEFPSEMEVLPLDFT